MSPANSIRATFDFTPKWKSMCPKCLVRFQSLPVGYWAECGGEGIALVPFDEEAGGKA